MKHVGDLALVAQEEVQQDLRALFRGAIRASLEVLLTEELAALVGPTGMPGWRAGAIGATGRTCAAC